MSAEVIPFPEQRPVMKAVTCACGSQQVLLILPGEVACAGCDHILATVEWKWKEGKCPSI